MPLISPGLPVRPVLPISPSTRNIPRPSQSAQHTPVFPISPVSPSLSRCPARDETVAPRPFPRGPAVPGAGCLGPAGVRRRRCRSRPGPIVCARRRRDGGGGSARTDAPRSPHGPGSGTGPAMALAEGPYLLLLAAALLGASASSEWSPPEPVFLPVEMELQAVPEHYRLQRADGALPANTSLHSRSDTFLLLPRHPTAGPPPLLRASYPPFSTHQEVPTKSHTWAVRAVPLHSTVSPDEPTARVLFHLHGPDWRGRRDPPGEHSLPCIVLQAQQRSRTLQGSCRVQAPLGICLVELEIPARWFSLVSSPESVELWYGVAGPGTCSHPSATVEPLRYVGMLELQTVPAVARRQEVPLDERVLLRVPDRALRPGQRFTASLALRHNFTAMLLTLRVKAKKGLQVVSARSADPAWAVHLERSRGPKHWSAVVTCRRSRDIQRSTRALEAAELLHLELAVENGTGAQALARPLTWQVEYPGQDPEAQKDKLVWEVQVSERDMRVLVPLVQELELLNTSPLTGVPRTVPVTLVTVEVGGAVSELSEPPSCESADTQVLQVSEGCDAVFVGGKESRGARGVRVDFWAHRLHASLLFTVWAPLLPLRVQLGDTALEQVRGWRLPGNTDSSSSDVEDPGEDAERRTRSCRPQYQRTAVRFLAYFVAHAQDGGRHLSYLPGPEWLLDVTHLVASWARVQDPRVASLEGGTVLVGREPGVTSVEVRSPLSDAILGEQMLVVSEEKVAVTELRAAVVAGLELALHLEPSHPGLLTAVCQATATLRGSKQEATLSVWLSFSDGTLAPMELYGGQDAVLAVTSLDPTVVTVVGTSSWHPRVVAEGPGQGALLQLSLHPLDVCRRGRHRAAVLAAGTALLEVAGERRTPPSSPRSPMPFPRAEGAMSGEAVTAGQGEHGDVGLVNTKLQGMGSSSEEEEEEREEGYGRGMQEEEKEEMVKAPARVSDLEIGMYVLLGVFCLAIFIFLVNCIFFVLRYQQKEPPDSSTAAAASQPHNWVWLGTDQEELSRQLDRRQPEPDSLPGPQPERCCCADPLAPDTGSPSGAPSVEPRKEGPVPGGSRRKRVEFVTFAPQRAPEDPPQPTPNVQSILVAGEDDIRWVCEDMGLRDPEELRCYMERIRGSS
ncbi:LOW QUALITY PROTEIN: transmembrane protein 132A [Lagopus muta]|uniref:LOW QUALITY PROTEIN: transmembrane protein 132A n=1 Tax=Lagopus muta TaxID=64668 RepID=UPI00209F90AD|nr:LOW QUALITY PROTEIN: transmembrane protein 132A [Lagopus muta]